MAKSKQETNKAEAPSLSSAKGYEDYITISDEIMSRVKSLGYPPKESLALLGSVSASLIGFVLSHIEPDGRVAVLDSLLHSVYAGLDEIDTLMASRNKDTEPS